MASTITILTLEDMLAFETRIKAFISVKLREMEEKPKPMFYSPAEVAKMVGLTVHAIRHRLRDPNEPILKGVQSTGIRGTWLIQKEVAEAWIESLKRR
jgi:hypothetical protein